MGFHGTRQRSEENQEPAYPLAAGGFLITNYQAEIAEYFEDGVDLVMAYTPEDMIQKTAYYLQHEDERKEIALNGQKKVFESFAYTKLLQDILKS